MTPQLRLRVVAVAGFLGAVAVFLPFVAYPDDFGSIDAMAFPPLPFVVHVPLALLGALMTVRIAGRQDQLPLGMPDRALGTVVAAYAIVALVSMLVAGNLFDGGVAPGIGFWVTLAASVTVGGASLVADTSEQMASAPRFEPTWVALRQQMELPDGRSLDPGTWYLAISRSTDGLVLRLDDGTETLVPAEVVLPEAGHRVVG